MARSVLAQQIICTANNFFSRHTQTFIQSAVQSRCRSAMAPQPTETSLLVFADARSDRRRLECAVTRGSKFPERLGTCEAACRTCSATSRFRVTPLPFGPGAARGDAGQHTITGVSVRAPAQMRTECLRC